MQREIPRSLYAVAALCCTAAFVLAADDEPAFDLTARVSPGDVNDITATLEVGGDLIVPQSEGEPAKLPLSVTAKMAYAEQIVAWPAEAMAARSLRRYDTAQATIKTQQQGVERELPADQRVVVAEISEAGMALRGLEGPLTREQFDLIEVIGNTLALDRLLPGKTLREGEGWDHDATVMAALLGMDHVAVCEVRSVVTGMENHQVQIRMAGTVHGTVDGAATEMELRAAYLYHLDRGRITKCNLAIKEHRKPGEATAGLDVVAKLSVSTSPAKDAAAAFDEKAVQQASAISRGDLRQLLVDAPARGYRFRHDNAWLATAEQRELMSLRLLVGGDMLAHCNVVTGPPRPADKPQTLPEFEREVTAALGDKVGKVAAATQWKTPLGLECLGVHVDGAVNDVEVQWHYYHLSAPGLPTATISVTVEQALLQQFADADRPLVDSMELVAAPAKTAAAPAAADATK